MWTTPKTDWYGVSEDGVYRGDRFNAVDFNRIKNNLEYLRDLAQTMYEEFAIHSLLMKSTNWRKTLSPLPAILLRGHTGALLPTWTTVTRWILRSLTDWRALSLTSTIGSQTKAREGEC